MNQIVLWFSRLLVINQNNNEIKIIIEKWEPHKTFCAFWKLHRRQDNAAASIWLLAYHLLARSRDQHRTQLWRRAPINAISRPCCTHLHSCHTQHCVGFYLQTNKDSTPLQSTGDSCIWLQLHFTRGVTEAKCILVTAICASVCPSPHSHTTARTRM